jgi:2-polyprenyl-3-methyl-5-hydroxy-6-metoxy-1,4-benzoquinol methylase
LAFPDTIGAYYCQTKTFLFYLIPVGPHIVMDVGCASGLLVKKLLENKKAIELIGIEIYAPAAREALKYYKTVHMGDIEELDIEYDNYFDIVVCGNVLEHLKDTNNILVKIRDG